MSKILKNSTNPKVASPMGRKKYFLFYKLKSIGQKRKGKCYKSLQVVSCALSSLYRAESLFTEIFLFHF
jgi:hypothetical protein